MKADWFRQTSKVVDGVETVLHTYTYGDSDWKDLLTAYDGYEITYDEIGNPESYYNGTRWTFDWAKGRQLVSAESDDCEIRYTYDLAGIRDSKTVDGVTYRYQTLNGKVVRQTWGNHTLDIIYDPNGSPYACWYDNTYCHYILNQQGDVIRMTLNNGTIMAEYQYDAWGNIISKSGDLADINPIRYRGYYYDTETGFYYLQSRYYDPSIGRFINADSFASTGQGFLGYNMFAYCGNNPITNVDPTGQWFLGAIIGGIGAAISELTAKRDVGEEINPVRFLIKVGMGAVAGACGGGVAVAVNAINALDAYCDYGTSGLDYSEALMMTLMSYGVSFFSCEWIAKLFGINISNAAGYAFDATFGTGASLVFQSVNELLVDGLNNDPSDMVAPPLPYIGGGGVGGGARNAYVCIA